MSNINGDTRQGRMVEAPGGESKAADKGRVPITKAIGKTVGLKQ